MGSEAKNGFGMEQLTAILGELSVAPGPGTVGDHGLVTAAGDRSHDTDADSGSDDMSIASQDEATSATHEVTLSFRGK